MDISNAWGKVLLLHGLLGLVASFHSIFVKLGIVDSAVNVLLRC